MHLVGSMLICVLVPTKISGYVPQNRRNEKIAVDILFVRRHTCYPLEPCGDGGKTTTQINGVEPLKLLSFKLFCNYYTFSKNSDNYLEKDLKSGVEIRIII